MQEFCFIGRTTGGYKFFLFILAAHSGRTKISEHGRSPGYPSGTWHSEDPLAAAKREFEEETGHALPEGEIAPLSEIKQPSGKLVRAWAIEGDCSVGIRSNLFSLEWPPKSGKIEEFPEVDRAGWFEIADARAKLLPGQHGFLDQLVVAIGYPEK